MRDIAILRNDLKEAHARYRVQKRAMGLEGLDEKAAAYGLSKEQTTAFLQKAAARGPGMLGKILRLAGAAGLGSAATIGAQKAPGLVQGVDRALAAHYNPLNGLKDWLQANPELGGAIGGGAAGAGIGALSGIPGGPDSEGNPQENHVLRNTLLGTLAGGGAGAGGAPVVERQRPVVGVGAGQVDGGRIRHVPGTGEAGIKHLGGALGRGIGRGRGGGGGGESSDCTSRHIGR